MTGIESVADTVTESLGEGADQLRSMLGQLTEDVKYVADKEMAEVESVLGESVPAGREQPEAQMTVKVGEASDSVQAGSQPWVASGPGYSSESAAAQPQVLGGP